MKWLARLLVFSLAIFIGVASGQIAGLFTFPLNVPDLTESVSSDELEPESAVSPSGVTVAYAGMGSDEGGTRYLKFIVHNGLYQPITYGAHSAENPFPRLKSNGNELPVLGRCGTGIRSFYVLPGSSAEFHVYKHEFTELPQKNARISAGFFLKPSLSGEYGPYYSEPFLLPEAFHNLIKETRQFN